MAYRPKLFAGIALDERTREGCARIARRLESAGLAARFEAPEKYHLTLAFLGWVDAERVGEIDAALRAVAARGRRFALTLDRIGAFPHERAPRVVWIGCRDQGEPFRALANDARRTYAELGFTIDKDAVAHVTVARVKARRSPVPMLDAIEPMRLHVRELTLFESIPAGRTTRYEPLAVVPLGSAADHESERRIDGS
jgi:2'-5' RNA ligase